MKDRSFLGRGWSFPPRFNLRSQAVDMVESENDIKQSLHILLSTSLGERVMQPKYGCNLLDYQFEALNAGMTSFLQDLVRTAILYHEPRIEVEDISVTSPDSMDILEGKFTISVSYSIISTNSRDNYVYDFYLREADSPI